METVALKRGEKATVNNNQGIGAFCKRFVQSEYAGAVSVGVAAGAVAGYMVNPVVGVGVGIGVTIGGILIQKCLFSRSVETGKFDLKKDIETVKFSDERNRFFPAIERLRSKFSSISEKDQAAIIAVIVSRCFDKDDEIRDKASNNIRILLQGKFDNQNEVIVNGCYDYIMKYCHLEDEEEQDGYEAYWEKNLKFVVGLVEVTLQEILKEGKKGQINLDFNNLHKGLKYLTTNFSKWNEELKTLEAIEKLETTITKYQEQAIEKEEI